MSIKINSTFQIQELLNDCRSENQTTKVNAEEALSHFLQDIIDSEVAKKYQNDVIYLHLYKDEQWVGHFTVGVNLNKGSTEHIREKLEELVNKMVEHIDIEYDDIEFEFVKNKSNK